MKSMQLNEANATLRLEGSEATRSMDIKEVLVDTWPSSGGLHLTVLDEKNIPIYHQVLERSQSAIPVERRFVFYDHLAVHVQAEKPGERFALTLRFT
ncbi:hypothetical protein [Pontibacter mangrovi]|uniref:Uncharacterized protein n=1 Tax=Pontibacter mangrovi TaxID=2589816 RepID=A0A501VYW6_9BACT|nr:hypothetical protein [Pontibacter mangrovi]TPE41034.1 hypothetical protein FJM65_19505 [Pontibacter mangrovi]